MGRIFKIYWIKPLLLILLFFAIMIITAFPIIFCFPKVANQIIYNDALNTLGTQMSLLLVVILSGKFFPLDKKILGLKIEAEKIPYLICLGFILIISTVIIMNILGYIHQEQSSESLFFSVLSIVMACILAPIIEELLFRGIIFNNLIKKYSFAFSAIYSSVLFAIIHVSFIRLLPIFIVGIALCWVLNKEQKIIYPILVHMTI